jgi:hypothetical protein
MLTRRTKAAITDGDPWQSYPTSVVGNAAFGPCVRPSYAHCLLFIAFVMKNLPRFGSIYSRRGVEGLGDRSLRRFIFATSRSVTSG